jgi:hypothetical protein
MTAARLLEYRVDYNEVRLHGSLDIETPSDLTERLRAAAELVGVLARDHVVVASGGYYSFVEAGRWRR